MRLSIRKFLLFNLLLAIIATTSLSTLGNYYLDQQDIQNNLDRLLSQAAFNFQTLLSDDLSPANLQSMQQRLDNMPQQLELYFKNQRTLNVKAEKQLQYKFLLRDKTGRLLLYSHNTPVLALSNSPEGFSDKYINDEPWRVFTLKDNSRGLIFTVAEHYDTRNWLAHRITEDDIFILLITFPLSGILIWLIVGRGLSSIPQVAYEVAQRAADRLDPVDLQAVPVEITPLIDELNKLFLRLKQAFEREQRFAADAAHELRTPLAALRTQAQVALKTLDSQERQHKLQNVVAGVDRCTHIIQQLLTLCRLNPDTVTLEDPTELDLAQITKEVLVHLAPSAVEKGIDLELVAQDNHDHTLIGNATGLHALIRNLVDNAIRYTPADGNIKVFLEDEPASLILRVVDNGPGIPPDLRSRVFERFFRIIGATAQGSGLGLAIVQQIVKLHRGTVTLGAPENGIGLEVIVTFPKPHNFTENQ